MKASFRAATAKDAPRIGDLLISTRAVFMPYAPSPHSEAEVRAWVASVLVPQGGVTVAEVGGRILGTLVTTREAEASWISQMAVDPAVVGRGLGSALLAFALHTLPRPVRLHAFQANNGARRFYERHGFVALCLTDGRDNEEHCPDVLYELARAPNETLNVAH